MTWNELEKIFVKAWEGTFSRKKLLMTFAALFLSGLLFIFCKSLAIEANAWIRFSLLLLPILLGAAFLLMLGVFLLRMEEGSDSVELRKFFTSSMDIAIGTSYLSLPPILAYLCLWIVMGLFFLLKEIPLLGSFFNVIFAFVPFLLIFCSLLLCLFDVGLLFFIAPAAALSSKNHSLMEGSIEFARKIWSSLQEKPFLATALCLIGLLPALFVGGVLSLAASLAETSFALTGPPVAMALKWFIVMLPFSALLSPTIIFFFHFAARSYQYLHRP